MGNSTGAAAVNPADEPDAAGAMPRLPWYRRYSRWRQTSREEAVAAESRLLALVGRELEAADVPVGPGPQDFMNTVVAGPADAPALVMVPGYGAGLGFFWRNLAELAGHFRVHALDLLGTGMSGRPGWKARTREDSEAFFLESLSTWRQAMGLDKMILVGHSMGGYLAARYALANPEHVQHLVLVCPAGVTRRPEDWQPPEAFRNPWRLPGMLYRTFNVAWEWGVTPGAVIRGLGPWGSGMIHGYVRRRFWQGLSLSEAETEAFQAYFYGIMAAPGSGEHALRHLLGPFAWAHSPLEDELKTLQVPVTFIYGDRDWMDPAGAHRAMAGLAKVRQPSSAADQEVITVPEAGHYSFLDQPQAFLQDLLRIAQPYLQKGTPQVPDVATGSPLHAQFPAEARNLRHIKPSPDAVAAQAQHQNGQPSKQNGHADPELHWTGVKHKRPRRSVERASSGAEAALDEAEKRTEL